jgi:2-polyprenyl-6-methoxyphenol hydroxylase-like FAD-dependent oxidoreductase
MLYDVAVIGAGPCGLAVAARLRETTPAALFTDDEHARYWKRFNRSESIEAERKSARRGHDRRASGSTSQYKRSIVVLDANAGGWMAAWRTRFRNLQIDQLRSPLFFHPDPRDRDGLLAFSHFMGRSDELEEIHHVVGKEISKHRAKKQRQKYVADPFIKITSLTEEEK